MINLILKGFLLVKTGLYRVGLIQLIIIFMKYRRRYKKRTYKRRYTRKRYGKRKYSSYGAKDGNVAIKIHSY